jgi:hypothetical protein
MKQRSSIRNKLLHKAIRRFERECKASNSMRKQKKELELFKKEILGGQNA